jgi:pSer/pThr/pTyr-binding forkhead associated (FHA) protein
MHMPMLLIPLNGGDPIALDKAITLLGRHPDCDAVLVSSRKVSRKHCLVAQVNHQFMVRDLGSMNGVKVNGEVAKGDTLVKEGDELHVGDIGFKLQIGPKPEKATRKSTAKPVMPGENVKRPPKKKLDPHQLSQDSPVAIPDEAADFIVEDTRTSRQAGKKPKRPTHLSDDVIVLSDEDIVGD